MAVRKDQVQVELDVTTEKAKTELDNVTRRAQVLTEELKGMRRGTDEYIAANRELKQVNKQMADLRKDLGLSGMSLQQLEKYTKELNRELKGLVPGTESFIAKTKQLQEVNARVDQVRNSIRGIDDSLKKTSWTDFFKKAAAFTGIQIGFQAILDIGKQIVGEIFNSTAEFEKFETVLTNALGDKSAAKRILAELQDLAKTTPFSIQELTASYLKFINRGLKPSMDDMTALGDIASSQGKSFDQLTEAVLDAGTGEFERLKEFGIRAKKSGDEVELAFKGIQKTVKNTPDAINEALLAFGKMQGVAGSMEGISKGLEGKWSNFMDALSQRAVSTGNALSGMFHGALDAMISIVSPAETATDAFKKQRDAVSGLEQNTVPLIERYEELKGKTSLNKTEQAEMDGIIKQIASTIPSAVSAFDKYGNAIGINTNLAREYIQAQQAMLKLKNKEAIEEQTEELEKLSESIARVNKQLNDRDAEGNLVKWSERSSNTMGTTRTAIKLTGDEILALQAKMSDLQNQKLGREQWIKELSGIPPEIKKIEDANKQEAKTEDEISKERLEALKMREAAIKIALAKSIEGSSKELALKKQLVIVSRDIELENEKKTVSDKELIRVKAYAELLKLDKDFSKKLAEEAKKRAEVEAAAAERIQELQISLIQDQFEKRIAQLNAQAAKETASVKGNDEQIAEQRRLIAEKLKQDLIQVEEDRIAKQLEAANRAIMAEAEIAVIRAERNGDPGGLEEALQNKLQKEYDIAIQNENLTNEEKLLLKEKFEQASLDITKRFAQEEKDERVKKFQEAMDAYKAGLQIVNDFTQIASDKQVTKEEKQRDKRLKDLEKEYKSGKISKEKYEKDKEKIESEADQKIRTLKNIAAQKEKAFQISTSIITGIQAVTAAAASPTGAASGGFLSPQAIMAGIMAAAATGKIIATPVPTFSFGGLLKRAWNGAKNTWNAVKKYATGGLVNPKGGVADFGQPHSNGGIQMFDGSTGQHLGEMEKAETYMILSKETTRNNSDIINELLDASLYRGGAPIRKKSAGIYAEDGAVFGQSLPNNSRPASSDHYGPEMLDALRQILSAVRSWPLAVRAILGTDVIEQLEEELREREEIRNDAAA